MEKLVLPLLGYLMAQKAVAAASAFVAQAVPGPASEFAGDIVGVVGQLGAIGALVWFCWYTTAKLIPEMQKRFETHMRQSEERYVRLLEMLCNQHTPPGMPQDKTNKQS